jgi:hypothetical protein
MLPFIIIGLILSITILNATVKKDKPKDAEIADDAEKAMTLKKPMTL